MEHPVQEGERILALAALRLTESRARATLAHYLLNQLANRARLLERDDLHDIAVHIWESFLDADPERSTPLELQAAVFAQAALWMREETILRLAFNAWGTQEFDIEAGADHVRWMPADECIVLGIGHTHPDGTTGRMHVVITPMKLAGFSL
jgi:hypothetical protein